ncbi:MAG: hypothetical protein P4L40_14770 [Terracidiphilus sp.]|nr:hypothetical protein [Terracidiphilus sp.]
MTADAKQALFFSCLNEQTADFTARTMAYQPPDLNEVGAAARAAMRASKFQQNRNGGGVLGEGALRVHPMEVLGEEFEGEQGHRGQGAAGVQEPQSG